MITSQDKKVSVIVPNYNYGRYFRKRMRSILRQTYPIYEIIVLDDASTDGSTEMAKSMVLNLKMQNPDLNIRFVGNKENSGKAIRQWGKGIALATGDYIWIAEADDSCSRDFLKEVMKRFDDSEVVVSYTESMIINKNGIVVAPNFKWSRDKEKTGHFKKSYIKDGIHEIEEIMAIRCSIPNISAVVFRKDALEKKDLEKAIEFTQVGDWYLYTKILEKGKISYNRKAMNRFRIHRKSKTAESKKDSKHYEEIEWMHNYFNENFKLSNKTKQAMKQEEMRVRAKHGIIEHNK
ncbi:glycosyltransferase family 2 protein [Candidatus Saccharibacteria bacterium]|nr:glycosyltransferase family 2 protein [Candidatus Saccharibacteria bacterium]